MKAMSFFSRGAWTGLALVSLALLWMSPQERIADSRGRRDARCGCRTLGPS